MTYSKLISEAEAGLRAPSPSLLVRAHGCRMRVQWAAVFAVLLMMAISVYTYMIADWSSMLKGAPSGTYAPQSNLKKVRLRVT